MPRTIRNSDQRLASSQCSSIYPIEDQFTDSIKIDWHTPLEGLGLEDAYDPTLFPLILRDHDIYLCYPKLVESLVRQKNMETEKQSSSMFGLMSSTNTSMNGALTEGLSVEQDIHAEQGRDRSNSDDDGEDPDAETFENALNGPNLELDEWIQTELDDENDSDGSKAKQASNPPNTEEPCDPTIDETGDFAMDFFGVEDFFDASLTTDIQDKDIDYKQEIKQPNTIRVVTSDEESSTNTSTGSFTESDQRMDMEYENTIEYGVDVY